MATNGSHIKDSKNTALRIIFFLEYFSISLELKSWVMGPSNPARELRNATAELLAFIAIANGEM